MKKTVVSVVSLCLSFHCILCLVSCNTVDKTGVWETAVYLKDTELG